MFLNLLSWYDCKLLKCQIACAGLAPKANHAFGEIKSGWILTMIVFLFSCSFYGTVQ